ncbi:hypothetical protein JTB14_006518 [Gonioctena quinquepunctata]|nr:hypothetical protein JTB14_006518 [Gonioctena quinquepunctata]
MNKNSAPGNDTISVKDLLIVQETIIPVLVDLVNKMFETGEFPKELKMAAKKVLQKSCSLVILSQKFSTFIINYRLKMNSSLCCLPEAIDLFEFSEIANEDEPEPPPASIVQYRQQMSANHNSSIFDSHLPSEDVTYIYSGRGRGRVSTIYRPGLPERDHGSAEDDIYRKIREVSGIGYSNEIIEKSLKAKQAKNTDDEFVDAKEPFQEAIKTYSPNLFDGASACPRSSNSTPSLSLSAESTVVSSPVKMIDTTKKTPPLSVILRKGREKKSEVITEKISSLHIEPTKNDTVSRSPQNTMKRATPVKNGLSSNEKESGSESEHFSGRGSCYSPISDKSSNTTDNDVWWRRNNNSHNESGCSSGDESLSWRRKTRSPPRYFQKEWRRDFSRSGNVFNINSDEDFPEL